MDKDQDQKSSWWVQTAMEINKYSNDVPVVFLRSPSPISTISFDESSPVPVNNNIEPSNINLIATAKNRQLKSDENFFSDQVKFQYGNLAFNKVFDAADITVGNNITVGNHETIEKDSTISTTSKSVSSSSYYNSYYVRSEKSINMETDYSEILERLKYIENQLDIEKGINLNLREVISNHNKNLKKLNNHYNFLHDEIDLINDDLYKMECRVIENNQYARRESLIISGIPDRITQNHLEETVIRILRSIGLESISSYQISACHRLLKKDNRYSAQTIVRFTNRKIVNYCLTNKNNLINLKQHLKMNLRFFESLCDANEYVLKECFFLKKYGIINDYYLRNGFVKIINIDNNKPVKIKHPNELYEYFTDYYDHQDLYNTF